MSARDELARVIHHVVCSDGDNPCPDEPEEWHFLIADAVLSEWLPVRLADLGSRLADATYCDDRGEPVVNASQALAAVAAALTPPP